MIRLRLYYILLFLFIFAFGLFKVSGEAYNYILFLKKQAISHLDLMYPVYNRRDHAALSLFLWSGEVYIWQVHFILNCFKFFLWIILERCFVLLHYFLDLKYFLLNDNYVLKININFVPLTLSGI
jgi:hypothetical protein